MRVTGANYPKLRDAFALVEQFLGVPSAAAADGGFDVPKEIDAKRLLAADRALAPLSGPAFSAVCERTAAGLAAGAAPGDVRAAAALLKLFAGGWQS